MIVIVYFLFFINNTNTIKPRLVKNKKNLLFGAIFFFIIKQNKEFQHYYHLRTELLISFEAYKIDGTYKNLYVY